MNVEQLPELAADFLHRADLLKAERFVEAETGFAPFGHARQQGVEA